MRLIILLLLFVFVSGTGQNSDDSDIIAISKIYKNGKLKKEPFTVTTARYGDFREGDRVEVLGFKNGNYLVRINDTVGYVYRAMYFYESQELKKFGDSIKRMERDSIEVYRIRQDSIKRLSESIDKTLCQYSTNKIDPISGRKRVYTNSYKIASYRGYNLNMQLANNEGRKLVWFFLDLDLGCASPYKNNRSKVEVKLSNSNIIKFYHSGDIDCGDFTLVGRITPGEIDKLMKSEIIYIRLTGTEGYQDFEEIDYPDFFQDKLKCIQK